MATKKHIHTEWLLVNPTKASLKGFEPLASASAGLRSIP